MRSAFCRGVVPIVIREAPRLGYITACDQSGGKWRDKRREKHCQFSFSWMNATTQTRSLKLKSNDFIPEEKQQLVEEKYADNIRKILCKSFIQWFWELNLCCYKSSVPSRLFWLAPVIFLLLLKWSWESRNVTKRLMSGPSGNQLENGEKQQ